MKEDKNKTQLVYPAKQAEIILQNENDVTNKQKLDFDEMEKRRIDMTEHINWLCNATNDFYMELNDPFDQTSPNE